MRTTTPSGVLLGQISYPSRDDSGNPLSMTDWNGTVGYTYDNNSRLDSATGFDYNYDWVGNRLNPPANPNPMQYNAVDQLMVWPGQHQYSYLPTGSLYRQKNSDGSVVQKEYAYTDANLLSSVTHAGVNDPSEMVWDADTNRVSFTSSTGGTTEFVYDPTAGIPAVIEETQGETPIYYIREPNGALVLRVVDDWTYHYYHFDSLGSTRILTDNQGTATDTYTYDAWGKQIGSTGSTAQPYRHVGRFGYYSHYQDENLFDGGGQQLFQVGNRVYDPAMGRFTQHGSPYTYAGNNPVSPLTVGKVIVLLPPFKNRNPAEIDADIAAVGYWSTYCALMAQKEAQGLVERLYKGKEDVWGDTLANAVMHCTLTCTMANKCGRDVARQVTNNHEKYNWNPNTGPMDLANNAEGLGCHDMAPPKCRGVKRDDAFECLKCCLTKRHTGRLHLLPKIPVPKYPGGN